MFYEPQNGHGLPHNPFNAIVTPRPIGWISTRSASGIDNLAPYSFFNATAYVPPQVMFASTGEKSDQDGTKDSVSNIRETGCFCVNIVGFDLKDAMNASSAMVDKAVDEFGVAKLEKAECQTIPASRVKQSPAALECKMADIIPLRGASNYLVLGEVVGVYIDDRMLDNGKLNLLRYKPLTRLGYRDYSHIDHIFSLNRPDD